MPTTKQIDAILLYLDRFAAPDFSAGTWGDAEYPSIPYFEYDDTVREFVHSLYDNDWINPQFDWGEWQDKAQEFIDSPQIIEFADLDTIKKLFTTHVRSDRFNEGHLAAMFNDGQIIALLQRLSELRKQIGE